MNLKISDPNNTFDITCLSTMLNTFKNNISTISPPSGLNNIELEANPNITSNLYSL